MRIVDDLIENVWDNQDAVVGHAVDVTLPVSKQFAGHLADMDVFKARISSHRSSRQADPDSFP